MRGGRRDKEMGKRRRESRERLLFVGDRVRGHEGRREKEGKGRSLPLPIVADTSIRGTHGLHYV